MASTDLKEIIGDLRHALAIDLRQLYPERDGLRGFSHSAEPYVAKVLLGIDVKERTADYYIAAGDGGGLIAVQVSEEDDSQWADFNAKDGMPVRVLRITHDRTITLQNPRGTQFERDLLEVLARHMPVAQTLPTPA